MLSDKGDPPRSLGCCAWWFRELEDLVPTAGRRRHGDWSLLYVGIALRVRAGASRPSKATLRSRIRYHLQGTAEGSTLRLSVGCVLADRMGIELRRVGSGSMLTFTAAGEETLNAWMDENARVALLVTPDNEAVKAQPIATTPLPLNLEINSAHPFAATLSALRRRARERARELPIAD